MSFSIQFILVWWSFTQRKFVIPECCTILFIIIIFDDFLQIKVLGQKSIWELAFLTPFHSKNVYFPIHPDYVSGKDCGIFNHLRPDYVSGKDGRIFNRLRSDYADDVSGIHCRIFNHLRPDYEPGIDWVEYSIIYILIMDQEETIESSIIYLMIMAHEQEV